MSLSCHSNLNGDKMTTPFTIFYFMFTVCVRGSCQHWLRLHTKTVENVLNMKLEGFFFFRFESSCFLELWKTINDIDQNIKKKKNIGTEECKLQVIKVVSLWKDVGNSTKWNPRPKKLTALDFEKRISTWPNVRCSWVRCRESIVRVPIDSTSF